MHASEAKVNQALQACRALLTAEEYNELFELNGRHNEWGLAIETLADILGEKEARLTPAQVELIEVAFTAMDLDPMGRVKYLRQLMGGK